MLDWLGRCRLQKRFMVITGAGVTLLSAMALVMIAWFQVDRMEETFRHFSQNELASLHALVLSTMAKRRADTGNIGIGVYNTWYEHRNADYPGKIWSVWSDKITTAMAQTSPTRTAKLPRDDIDREAFRTGQPVARFVDGAYRYSMPIVLGQTDGADTPNCMKCHLEQFGEHDGDVIAVFSSSLSTDQEFARLRNMMLVMAASAVIASVGVMWTIRAILGRVIGSPMTEMTGAMSRLAGGDLKAEIPGLGRADEIGDMAEAVAVFKRNAIDKIALEEAQRRAFEAQRREEEEAKRREAAIMAEVAEVTEGAVAGDLERRIDLAGKEGFLRHLCEEVNDLLHLTSLSLKDVAEVMAAVAQGDLTKRITSHYQGLFGQLKSDVNNTADTLQQMLTNMRNAANRMQQVLETAAEGIYGVDTENKVMFANRAAAELLGWPSAEEMLGRNSAETLHHMLGDGRPCCEGRCAIRSTLVDGQTRRVVGEFFVRRDGVAVPVEFAVAPLYVDDSIAGAVMVFHDVTEKRRTEREISRLLAFQRTILQAAGNAIIATDTSGTVTLFNPAAERMLGLEAAQVIRKEALMRFFDWDEITQRAQELTEELGQPVGPGFTALVAKVAVGAPPDVREWTFLREDGTTLPVLVSLSPLTDATGEVSGYIALAQDISALKSMAQELKNSNAELEQFAYVASHDLRQPLRSIASYMTLLEMDYGDKLDADGKEYLGFARSGAERMDHLIIDLLEYSRIGRKDLATQQIALADVMEEVEINLHTALTEAGGQLVVEGPLPELPGDRVELVRLFQNIVGNALKYHAPDRAPKVTVSARREDRHWVIAVADNGIGIKPEHFDRIFGIFQRLHGREEFEGTGIGLAACKKIVEHHKGRIWLESVHGEGSTFLVALPVGE
jgi:PAS domain S-box-containing protein